MLNSGEVPNIFGSDEKAELCEKMRVVRNWACNIVKTVLTDLWVSKYVNITDDSLGSSKNIIEKMNFGWVFWAGNYSIL